MNELWTITLDDGQELGPFSRAKVLKMIEAGELKEDSVIKKDELPYRFILGNLKEFEGAFQDNEVDTPPPFLPPLPVGQDKGNGLPPLPVKGEEQEASKFETPPLPIEREKVLQSNEIEDPPPFNPIKDEDDKKVQETFYDDSEIEGQSLSGEKISYGPFRILRPIGNGVVLFVSGIVVTGLVLYSIFLLNESVSKKLVPSNLSVKNYRSIIQKSKSKQESFSFYTSRDYSNIWVSLPHEGNFQIYGLIKSIEGKIVSTRPVVADIKGEAKGRIGHLARFDFKKGTSLRPGFYEVDLYFKEEGLLASINRLIRRRKDFSYKNQILVYTKEESKFKVELSDFIKEIKDHKTKFLRDRLEKYKTLLSFLNNSKEKFLYNLEKGVRGSSFEEFEQDYLKNTGPLFQKIVVETSGHISKLGNPNSTEYKEYSLMIEKFRAYGEIVTGIVDSTKSERWLRDNVKASLEETFGKRILELEKEIQDHMSSLEERIKKF